MNIHFLFALCNVLIWNEVLAEIDNEIKRGVFPFMAFIYYPDETVVDTTGARFQRAALLIKPQWLVSAAIDHSVLDNVPLGFPRKTLLARVGAVTLDSNYTLNEDEDEQEREIIQIIRPSIHNPEVWWFTDITLLKTLLPFKLTSAVAITSISTKREFTDKNCVILVFAKKYSNATEDKILQQIGVELLPPSTENCGIQFSDSTMICALDSDETKTSKYDNDYCQGNSGGPLLCEGEVMALQTYIENNCNQPHLYQLFASWETFIACGTAENCNKNEQCNICVVINKDPEVDSTIPPTASLSALDTNISTLASLPAETMILGTAELPSENTETYTLKDNIENTSEDTSENTMEHTTEHTTEHTSEHHSETDLEHHSEMDSDDHSKHYPEIDSERRSEQQPMYPPANPSMNPPSDPSMYPPSEPSMYPPSDPSMYPPADPSMYESSSEYSSNQTNTEHFAENSLEDERTNTTADSEHIAENSLEDERTNTTADSEHIAENSLEDERTNTTANSEHIAENSLEDERTNTTADSEHIAENSLEDERTNTTADSEHIAENSLEDERTNTTADSTTDSSMSSSFSSTENITNEILPLNEVAPLENKDIRMVKTENVTRKPKVQELRQWRSENVIPRKESQRDPLQRQKSSVPKKKSGQGRSRQVRSRQVSSQKSQHRGFGIVNYLIIFFSMLACLI